MGRDGLILPTPTGKVGFALKLNAKRIVYIVLAVAVVAGLLLAIDYFSDGMFGQAEVSTPDASSAAEDASSSAEASDTAIKKDPTENMTVSEKLVYGLTTAGVGMSMVFLVLIILWGLIAFIPKILPEEKPKAPASSAKVATVAASPDEEELVAVCTAAIAAARGASDCAFKVISITEIK